MQPDVAEMQVAGNEKQDEKKNQFQQKSQEKFLFGPQRTNQDLNQSKEGKKQGIMKKHLM